MEPGDGMRTTGGGYAEYALFGHNIVYPSLKIRFEGSSYLKLFFTCLANVGFPVGKSHKREKNFPVHGSSENTCSSPGNHLRNLFLAIR